MWLGIETFSPPDWEIFISGLANCAARYLWLYEKEFAVNLTNSLINFTVKNVGWSLISRIKRPLDWHRTRFLRTHCGWILTHRQQSRNARFYQLKFVVQILTMNDFDGHECPVCWTGERWTAEKSILHVLFGFSLIFFFKSNENIGKCLLFTFTVKTKKIRSSRSNSFPHHSLVNHTKDMRVKFYGAKIKKSEADVGLLNIDLERKEKHFFADKKNLDERRNIFQMQADTGKKNKSSRANHKYPITQNSLFNYSALLSTVSNYCVINSI